MKHLFLMALLCAGLTLSSQEAKAQTVHNITCADMEVLIYYDDPFQVCGGALCQNVGWHAQFITAGSSYTFTVPCVGATTQRVEATENGGIGFADWVKPVCTGSVVNSFTNPCGTGLAYGVTQVGADYYIYGF